MGICGVSIHRVAAAPRYHGLRDVGLTEWNSVKFLYLSYKAAVSRERLPNVLGQANGAVIAGDIETFLNLSLRDHV